MDKPQIVKKHVRENGEMAWESYYHAIVKELGIEAGMS